MRAWIAAAVWLIACEPHGLKLYSCDNVDVLGGAACSEPGSPEHMTVALYDEPNGDVVLRLSDDGQGRSASLLEPVLDDAGEAWLRVRTFDGRLGYVPRKLTRGAP